MSLDIQRTLHIKLKSAGTKIVFAIDVLPFSNHSSSPKVILDCQEYLQKNIKKQDLVPL